MSIDRKIGKLIKLGKLSDNISSSIDNSNNNNEVSHTNGNKSSGPFSFSNNQNSIPNLFEENFEESNSDPSTQPSSIKHIVLKYKLSENDFLFDPKCSGKGENNFLTREAIILTSLMNFDLKQSGEEHKKIIEFIPQGEKPNPMELNLYRAIDGCVKNKLIKTKTEPNSENKKSNISCANLGKLAFRLKNNYKSLEFIAIKAIMISMINLMNEIISTLQIEFTNKNTLELDGEIFTHIYKQFLIMSNICPYIENDFSSTFELFKSKYQLNFTLSELFSDIYWDVVFGEKHIRLFFIRNFNSEISEALKGIFTKIVNALWLMNFPLKRQISELLDIKKMIGNKIDLASCIVEEKENSEEKKWNRIKMLEKNEIGLDEIEKEDIPEKEKEDEEDKEKGNKSEKELITENHVQDKEVIEEEDTKETTNCPETLIESEELKEDIKEEKEIIPESEKKEKEKEIIQEIKNNMIIDNNISISSNSNKNNEKNQKQKNYIQDNKSIEEIYNYIVNVNDENLNNNGKRKNKKKNKRKKSMNNNITYNNKHDISNEINKDPVVEQFKSELCGKVVNAGEIQKIKPMISSEWIQKITFNA